MPRPEEDVDRVEDSQKGKAPVDRVDDNLLSASGELEEHGAEEQEVDEGPHPECVSARGDVSHLCSVLDREGGRTNLGRAVHVLWPCDRVDV